jgi:threonylcarbamoyladenosine tRNA methylthiotransferase MtaB
VFDVCIGVDVICGFPGESEENFIETYSFLNDLPISYLHVFKYSERQNTEAFTMNKKVPIHIRNKRSNMLRMLSIKKRRSFYESQIGKKTNILLEGENKNGYIQGFTRNYVKVRAPWNPDLVNQIVFASLKEIDEEGFMRYEVII